MTDMTARQLAEWPKAVERLRQYAPQVPLDTWNWLFDWKEEFRPGRGQDFNAVWLDGDQLVYIHMDVYGNGGEYVADISQIHSSTDEECKCEPCIKEREEA